DQHPVLAAIEPLVPHVAHVGDVLDMEHRHAVVQDRPADEVGQQERPQVADVGVAVDRRAAGVHPEPGAVGRLDGLERAGQGVPESEAHGWGAGLTKDRLVDGTFARILPRFPLTFPTRRRYRIRGLAAKHRSPGGVTCEASFAARNRSGFRGARSDGPRATPPYTPAMRRWVCIIALLAGFAGDDYVRGARLANPAAIERLVDGAGRAVDGRRAGLHGWTTTGAWWSRSPG